MYYTEALRLGSFAECICGWYGTIERAHYKPSQNRTWDKRRAGNQAGRPRKIPYLRCPQCHSPELTILRCWFCGGAKRIHTQGPTPDPPWPQRAIPFTIPCPCQRKEIAK